MTTPVFPTEFNISAQPDQGVPVYLRRTEHLPKNKTVARASRQTTDEVTIELDTSTPGAFIDPRKSYLAFDLEIFLNDPSQQALVQFGKCGVNGIIDELNIEASGVPLEPQAQYGMLLSCLMDMYGVTGGSSGNIVRQMQGIPMQSTTHRFVMDDLQNAPPEFYGQRINHPDDIVFHMPQQLIPVDDNTDDTTGTRVETRYDAVWTDPNGKTHPTPFYAAGQLSTSAGKMVRVSYKIPLMSGILGTANRHLFPAFLIPAGSLSIKLKLARIHECMTLMSPLSRWKDQNGYVMMEPGLVPTIDDTQLDYYELRNLRYVAQQVILSEDLASEVIRKAMRVDIPLFTTSWRHTSTYVRDAYQGDHQIVLQHKVASAKMTLYAFRDQNAIGKAGVLPYSRTSFGQTYDPATSATWQLRIGNDLYPVKPADTAADTLVEAEQAMQQWGDLRHESGLLTQYLHTNSNTYCSDFSHNLWHCALTWLQTTGGNEYPFLRKHTDQAGEASTTSLATYQVPGGPNEYINFNPADLTFDGAATDKIYQLYLKHKWVHWDNGAGFNGKGAPANPTNGIDLRKREVLIIRLPLVQKSTGERHDFTAGKDGSDYIHFQMEWDVDALGNDKSALDIINDVNAEVERLKTAGGQFWNQSSKANNQPPFQMGFRDSSGNFSTTQLSSNARVAIKSSWLWDKAWILCPIVTMTPGLAECLGFKKMDEYDFSNPYYVMTSPYGATLEFTSTNRLGAEERRYPGSAVFWGVEIDPNQAAPNTVYVYTVDVDRPDPNNATNEVFRTPYQFYYGGSIPNRMLVADYAPANTSALPRNRPISSYSNALICINHESFDDQGGKLRSGRLLGNNTLYLELKNARFRRQYFGDYRNPNKPDNHLLLYSTFTDMAMRGEIEAERGASVRLDSWVLHDLRVSIQSGGVMQSFY